VETDPNARDAIMHNISRMLESKERHVAKR
jgi:hypothetical protein